MKHYLLTIFIPTFNRANCLSDTLTMFFNQIIAYSLQDRVAIIVGNNASTDNTNFILSSFNKLSKVDKIDFKYYINDCNIGITSNILTGLKFVNSKYVWIFGDDDVIANKLLDEIVLFFENEDDCNHNLFVINNSPFTNIDELEVILTNYTYKLRFEKNILNKSNLQLFDINAGFISSLILKKNDILTIFENLLNSYPQLKENNYFIKLAIYYLLVQNKYRFHICHEILLFQRITHGSHFTQSYEKIRDTFYFNLLEVYHFQKKLISNKIILDSLRNLYFNNKLFLFLARLNEKNPLKFLYCYYRNTLTSLPFILALTIMPKSVSTNFYLYYKKVKKTPIPPVIQKVLN